MYSFNLFIMVNIDNKQNDTICHYSMELNVLYSKSSIHHLINLVQFCTILNYLNFTYRELNRFDYYSKKLNH